MKEFFDRLDARMLAFFKGQRGKNQKRRQGAPRAKVLQLTETESPIFLLMGSLSGCTFKDADVYARGLAESFVKSPHLGRIHLHEDKPNRRFIYEIHEGGPERSVIEKVVAELNQGKKVGIQLANGATTVIEEANGEIFSLIYPTEEEGSQSQLLRGEDQVPIEIQPVEAYASDLPLKELFPQKHQLKKLGFRVLGATFSLFVLTGGIYTVVASGALEGDIITRQAKAGLLVAATDNPVWQLERARQAAEAGGQYVLALKKTAGKWSWELSSSGNAPSPEPGAAPGNPAPSAPPNSMPAAPAANPAASDPPASPAPADPLGAGPSGPVIPLAAPDPAALPRSPGAKAPEAAPNLPPPAKGMAQPGNPRP